MNQKLCILYDTDYKVKTPLLTNRGQLNVSCGNPQGINLGRSIPYPVTTPSGENVTFDQTIEDRVEFKPCDSNRPEQKLMKLEWIVLSMLDRAELNNEPYLIAKMRIGSQESFDRSIWSNNLAIEYNIPIPLKIPRYHTIGDSASYNLPTDCKCIPPQLSDGYWTEPSSKPKSITPECKTLSDYCPSLSEGRYFIIQEENGEVVIDLNDIANSYSLPELGAQLEILLNNATVSNNEYEVYYDGLTNKFTIKANGKFGLKFGTGSLQESGAYFFFGFPKIDTPFSYQITSTFAFPPVRTVTIRKEDRTLRVKEKTTTSRETAEFDVIIPNLEYTYASLADKLQECFNAASLRNGVLKKLGGHTGYQYIVKFNPDDAKFLISTCNEEHNFSLLLQLSASTNKLPQILGFDRLNTSLGGCAESYNSVHPVDMVEVPSIIPYVAEREIVPNSTDIELNDWGNVYLDDTYYCTQRVLAKPDELFFMKIVKPDGSGFREITNPYLYLPCNHPLKQFLPEIPTDYEDTCGWPFKIPNLYRFSALVSFQNVPLGYSNSDKNGRVPPPVETANINAPFQGNYVTPPLIQDGRRTNTQFHPNYN